MSGCLEWRGRDSCLAGGVGVVARHGDGGERGGSARPQNTAWGRQ